MKKTDELFLDEVTYFVEETLKGVKAAYKVEEIEPNVKLKITLQ